MSEQKTLRGMNWGKIEIKEKNLYLKNKDKEVLSLPLQQITNSIATKQDITLEMNTDDLDDQEDLLSEIRFYIPQAGQDLNKKDDENEESQEVSQEASGQEDKITFIKQLNQEIVKQAKIGANAGESICSFSDLQLMVPRGKFEVDFYKTTLRLHGASMNYVIEYKNISRTFLLPLPDEVQVAFVIGLTKPLKQGNTIHPFIVVYFKRDHEISINLKIKEEDMKKYEWDVDLEEPSEGPTYEVFAKLFKQIIRVNIFIPGNFQSSEGLKAVNCSVKTNAGFFFPLQKSIIFIKKPVIYIPHSEIQVVEFDRIEQASKMFDIRVVAKSYEASFVGFDKKELVPLIKYFKDRKVKIQKTDAIDGTTELDLNEDGTLPGQRAEGKRVIKAQTMGPLLDDDDEEEEDSDFDASGGEDDEDDDDEDESGSQLAKIVDEDEEDLPVKKNKKNKNKDGSESESE